jgi:hypothetical protein
MNIGKVIQIIRPAVGVAFNEGHLYLYRSLRLTSEGRCPRPHRYYRRNNSILAKVGANGGHAAD